MGSRKLSKSQAFANAKNAIQLNKALPHNVFAPGYGQFVLFESDMLFDAEFVTVLSKLLHAERAVVGCLANLEDNSSPETSALFLDQSVSGEQYLEMLRQDGGPNAWLYTVDRYACSSDRGSWAIYCEKENDVAVFAVREGHVRSEFLIALKALKGTAIEDAQERPQPGFFDFGKLTEQWREALLNEYRTD